MQQSLAEGYENLLLIYDKDSPLPSELRYMLKGMIENRESEEELLTDFARRSRQEDIRNFVDVYKACRITGGDMEKPALKGCEDIHFNLSHCANASACIVSKFNVGMQFAVQDAFAE